MPRLHSVICLLGLFCFALISCSKESAAPRADFVFKVLNAGTLPATVDFVSTSNTPIVSWTFGDGSPNLTTDKRSITHVYGSAGAYAVQLVAIGKSGRDSIVKYVPIVSVAN